MTPERGLEEDLRTLFAAVRRSEPGAWEDMPHIVLFADRPIGIGGDDYALYRSIQWRMAGSALQGGRLTPTEAGALLSDACRLSVTDVDAATRTVLDAVAASPEDWSVVIRVPMTLRYGDLLHVGPVIFHHALPAELAEGLPPGTKEVGEDSVAQVEVLARGQDSAEIVGEDRLDEALGVVRLASQEMGYPVGGSRMIIDPDGRRILSSRAPHRLYVNRMNDVDELWPGYREAANAVGRTVDQRTDWERRVLAAGRWFRRTDATWPSERLVAAMAALECLCVRDRREREKGLRIAERVKAQGARTPTRTVDATSDWLLGLYRSRNDALHEGRPFEAELEIAELVDLAERMCHWALQHLDPFHDPDGPCQSFDQAHAPHP